MRTKHRIITEDPVLVGLAGRDEIIPCYYCGMPATSVDHVVPQVVLEVAALSTDPAVQQYFLRRHRIMTVDCCRECNSVIGARYFDTLELRKAYLKERMRVRYRDLLATPDWSDTEIAELSGRLQRYVVQRITHKAQVKRRLTW